MGILNTCQNIMDFIEHRENYSEKQCRTNAELKSD